MQHTFRRSSWFGPSLAALLVTSACDNDVGSVPAGDTSHADDLASDTTVADSAPPPDTTPVETLPETPTVYAFCEGTTHFAWDPTAAATKLAAFPDDAVTRDDATSLTGLRVDLGAAPAWLATEPEPFKPLWRQLDQLDGFGTSAGVILHFDRPVGPVPSGAAASVSADDLRFYDLSQDPPERVAFESEVIDDGTTIILWPMRPLREKALHAVVMTTAHLAADGACVSPSAPLRALLANDATAAPEVRRLASRVQSLLAKTGLASDAVSALSVFTTQAITEITLSNRADIAARSFDWKTAPTCAPESSQRKCHGTFMAFDYRNEGYLGDPKAPTPYELPLRVWLPSTAPLATAAPVLVFGHGLGGKADDAASIARIVGPLGFATVALPAPRHGDHPTARHEPNADFLDLLGIDVAAFTIHGFTFRENVRQAVFDKLQAIALLRTHADVDGDGQADLDLDRTVYWGISLGGIMGTDLAALSRDVRLAVLSVPGARVLSIITDAPNFSTFKDILAGIGGGDGAVAWMAVVGQTLVDAGDPVNWAPHILRDRIDDRDPPHLLMQMVIDDSTVPNVATRSLARAVAIAPQVPPIIRPIEPLAASGTAPIQTNVNGTITAGLFEFDRVSSSPGGSPRVATHSGVFSGIEAVGQVEHFLTTWLATPSAPTSIDPYATNGTPPLP